MTLRQVLISSGSAATNFISRFTSGMSFAGIARMVTGIATGVTVTQSPLSNAVSTTTGVGVSTSASGDIAVPATSAGISMTGTGSGSAATPLLTSGVELTQIKYDLTRRIGAATVTEYAVNARTDFVDANLPNALGLHNATEANCNSNALGARSGGLRLEFDNHVNKSALTIQTVRLHFYTRTGATAGATVRHQWRIGTGAWITLATHTSALNSAIDYSVTPDTFDITSSVTGWADLDAIEASVEVELALLGPNASVDAVELEIIATATEIL